MNLFAPFIRLASVIRLGWMALAALTMLCLPDVHDAEAQVLAPTVNPLARAGRFAEGTSSIIDNQTFILTLDFQMGIPLDRLGDSAAKFSPTTPHPWVNQIAKTQMLIYPYDITVENPLAAFGAASGGTPLLTGQSYAFGTFSGIGAQSVVEQYRVRVFRRSDFAAGATNIAPVDVLTWSVPTGADPAAWAAFLQNGGSITVEGDGLKTVMQINDQSAYGWTPWGLQYVYPAVSLRHLASAASSDYFYLVEAKGDYIRGSRYGMTIAPMAIDNTTNFNAQWVPLYAMDFSVAGANQATILRQPQFTSGDPLPPEYDGKSIEDLLHDPPPVSLPVALDPADCLALDASPELRRHPVLDQFVSDHNNDPIALANYVINEIGLINPVAPSDDGNFADASINEGGVDRGALAVFQEGRGSPTEQCALLIYLLRQAGVPAAYIYPERNSMKLLDRRVSTLLGTQISGALNAVGQSNVPHLVPVNYPWVAAYINGQWVHLFPWLKDMEIVEGSNLYDLMPNAYDNGFKIARAYLYNDPFIFGSADPDSTFGDLMDDFLTRAIHQAHPNVSLDQVGVRVRQRPNNYTRFEDFPRPFAVGPNSTARTSLSDTPQIFNTISIALSTAAGRALGSTGTLRMADLHNRRLFVRTEKTGSYQHQLRLNLEALRPGTDGTGMFTDDPDLIRAQEIVLPLDSGDDQLQIQAVHDRQRTLDAFPAPQTGTTFLQVHSFQEVSRSSTFRKGDAAAICFDLGVVSSRMMAVHAQNLWNQESARAVNPQLPVDPNVSWGDTAYLLAQTFFFHDDRFREEIAHLNKNVTVSVFQFAVATLGALRDPATGNLPNDGDVTPCTPGVDISAYNIYGISNNTIHANSGQQSNLGYEDFINLYAVGGSSDEHGCINRVFRCTDAISTVRLLQLAQTRAANGSLPQGILELTKDNYASIGSQTYEGGVPLSQRDPNIWSEVSYLMFSGSTYGGRDYYGFITPGAVYNPTSTRLTVGALLLNGLSSSFSALIGDNLAHGGRGSPMPGFFSADTPSTLRFDNQGGFVFVPSRTDSSTDLDQIPTWDEAQAVQDTGNGTALDSPAEQAYFAQLAAKYGFPLTSDWNADQAALLQYIRDGIPDTGFVSTFKNTGDFVMDPVNSVTGEFHLDATDLVLPGPMPLAIRRNYASFNLADGQFGQGWKTAYVPALTVIPDGSVIYAADADGSVIAYRHDPSNANVWRPAPADNPTLNNINAGRTGGLGNTFNNQISRNADLQGNITYVLKGADGSTRTFPVLSFPTADGFAHQHPYLTRWQDNRGNAYNFSYGTDASQTDYGQVRRVASTNGDYLGFSYDIYGHIVQAYTGDGRQVTYEYDGYGDLINVTLPDASEIGFDYLHGSYMQNGEANGYSTHLLIRERKPDGHVIENNYDDQRRVVVQRAPVDQDLTPVVSATFIYSQIINADGTVDGNTVVQDAYGRPTRFDYTAGQITKITDPLNQMVSRTWYQPGDTAPGAYPRSLKSETDKRGLLTEYQYDAQGNFSGIKLTGDLTGNGNSAEVATTTTMYNALNLPASVSDPSGNVVLTFYEDPAYPYLPTRTEHHSPDGGLVSETTMGYVAATDGTGTSYGLLGTLKRAANSPDEAVTTWSYSGGGYPSQETRQTGTTDPAITVQSVYNGRGELIQRTDADNRQQAFAYDGLGDRIWQETRESDGHLLGWNYDYFDGNGQQTWHQGSRYNPTDYLYWSYDGDGRMVQATRWRSQAKADGSGVEAVPGDALAATTTNMYDLFGNLVLVHDPRGHETAFVYDAIGQVMERRSYQGTMASGTLLSKEDYDHEPGGLVKTITNALGGVTNKFYTSRGQIRRQENPDGSVSEWHYGLDGRLTRETRSDGSYWTVAYDDLNRIVTRTLTGRTGNVLASTSQTFDRRGNMVSRMDAEGNVFATAYDDLDRVKTTTGPAATSSSAQQQTTFVYDASGRTTQSKNTLGETTTSITDALDRPISVTIVDAAGNVVRQRAFGYSSDQQAVTITEGSGTGAITTTQYTDLSGAAVLTRYSTGEYDLSGYDASGNLASRLDTLGRTTSFVYDGLNRRTQETLPDGSQTIFAYDALGDLLERRMPAGLSAFQTFDAAGRVQTSSLHGSSNGGVDSRQVGYAYYGASSPFVGLRQSSTDARGITHTLVYDDFLRVGTIQSIGSAPELSMTTVYSYDRCDRLTSVIQNPGSPTTGPPTSVVRSLDAYGQIIEEAVKVDGNLSSDLRQRWDGAGRRGRLSSSLPIQGLGAGTQFDYAHLADGNLASVQVRGVTGAFGFDYGNNGLLLDRHDPWRTLTVDSRDRRGRVLQQTNQFSGSNDGLVETLGWRSDSTLSSYGAARTGTGTFNEARSYDYNSRGQLLHENFVPSTGPGAALSYGFDFDGSPGGLGIRTRAQVSNGYVFNASGVDPLGRVFSEQTNGEPKTFTAAGQARGAASVEAQVDGVPVGPVSYAGQSSGDGGWSVPLRLPPGSHVLIATAHHPSGAFNPQTTSVFTVSPGASAQTLISSYDGMGNVVGRVVSGGGRSQTLTWDALDRMVAVTQRDNGQNNGDGLDWSAIYDGLGRRIETITTPVTGGAAQAAKAVTVQSTFDPQIEFLEIGIAVQPGSGTARRLWKVYGPDLGGAPSGSLQGTGGLEAMVREGDGAAIGIASNHFGDVAATLGAGDGAIWHTVPVGGYGALAGQQIPVLETLLQTNGAGMDNLAVEGLATEWRGRRLDPTGFYWMGARTYDPEGGRFLSADPLGNAASADLYSYSGGDPVNYLDTDGRCFGQSFAQGYNLAARTVNGIYQTGLIGSDMIGFTAASAFGFGDSYDGNSDLFKNLAANPANYNTNGLRDDILLGGLKAEANVATLGTFGLSAGAYQTYQTGNFNALQDGAFGAATAASLYKIGLSGDDAPSSALARTAPASDEPWMGGEFINDTPATQPSVSTPDLRNLTDQAHDLLGSGTKWKSTAVGQYADGSLGIASSDSVVPRIQREWADENGINVMNGDGHAEATLVAGATPESGPLVSFEVSSPYGLKVVDGVPTNPNGAMCGSCATITSGVGATTSSPIVVKPIKKGP